MVTLHLKPMEIVLLLQAEPVPYQAEVRTTLVFNILEKK